MIEVIEIQICVLIYSIRSSIIDEDRLRHVLLCRVLLGRTELVRPGSGQSYPSSEEFDSGVDNLLSPKKYIVWSTHMNTHILPEFVISFTTDPSFLRGEKIDMLVAVNLLQLFSRILE